jgi:protein O-mannosyl-transferase
LKTKKLNKKKIPVSISKHNRIIYLLFLVLVPLVLYFRVVNFGLSGFDDETIISNITNTEGAKFDLNGAFTHDAAMSDKGSTFYRPMQIISLMIDSELGGSEPWIYHLSNLILHIITVLALFFFLTKTGVKEEISFFLALLFSIHPLFTHAVVWIPARGDLLLCLFSLLSFISVIEYFKNRKKVYIFIHGVVFASAMFSKETAVLLPVLILSYLYLVQRKKYRLKEIIPFLSIWVITIAVFFVLRQSVLKVNPSSNEFGILPFIKNLPTIPIIFGKFFIPYNLCTMPFFDNTAAIIGITLSIILAVLIIKIMRGEKRIVIWGVLWFLAFSIPPMFFRSPFADFRFDYSEYRSYLPSIGILLIIGFLLNELTIGISIKKRLIISIPLLLVYSLIAFIYSEDFKDPFSYYSSAIKPGSKNALALAKRGFEYLNRGDDQKALLDFENSIRIYPYYSMPYYNKGLIYHNLKDYYQAENSLSLALKYDTLYKDNDFLQEAAYLNLSVDKLYLKKYDEAILILRKGINKYPDKSNLHLNLAITYLYSAKYDSALGEYNKVLESGMVSPQYYNGRGMVKDSLNDFLGAITDFSKALELKEGFFDALKNRGFTKIKMKDNAGAINDLTTAININPNIGMIWYYRGLALSNINKQAEAKADWEKAGKLGVKVPIRGKKDK